MTSTMLLYLAGICLFYPGAGANNDHSQLCNEHDPCWKRFIPISDIMSEPQLDLLLNSHGKINLNCSASELSAAESCEDEANMCYHGLTAYDLLISWKHFCGNIKVVEKNGQCWINPELLSKVLVCVEVGKTQGTMSRVPVCVGEEVSAIPDCGIDGGRLFQELLSKFYHESSLM